MDNVIFCRRGKPFYGWFVCLGCMITIFITMGVISNCFSVFLPYIMTENGFTNTEGTSLTTLRCLVSFVAMFATGSFYHRFSLRWGLVFTLVVGAVSFLLYAVAESYYLYAIASCFSGLSYGLGSMIPVTILISRWFDEKRAVAVSICAAGSGIAAILMPIITSCLVETFSLAAAFYGETFGIVVLMALVACLLRNDPSEKRLEPYNIPEKRIKTKNSAYLSPKEPLKKVVWYHLYLIAFLMGSISVSVSACLALLFRTEGFSVSYTAILISVYGIFLTVFKVVYGEMAERFGGKKTTVAFLVLLCFGIGGCALSFFENEFLAMISCVLVGLGFPVATVGFSVWATDLTIKEEFSIVIRRLQIIYAAGALACSSLPGVLADVFSSYIPAFLLFFLGMVIILLLFLRSYALQLK